MPITRFWGSTAVLSCALLLQSCQPHSVSITDTDEEKEPATGTSPASAVRQRTSSEPSAVRSLAPPSTSLAANVPPSRSSTAPAQQDGLAAPFCRLLIPSESSALATVSNPLKDAEPSAKRQNSNLAPEDELASKRVRAREEAEPDKAAELLKASLVVTQVDRCRQSVLEALGDMTKTSPDMFHSLRAIAKTGARDVRLLALKTLGEVEWKHYFGDVEPAPDLPGNIDSILDSTCPFWPGKKVKDTHLLVLVSAKINGRPFSLNLLSELIQHPKNGGHKTSCRYYDSRVKAQLGTASPAVSYWLLMTRDALPESHGKSYRDQEKLVADQAKRAGLPYELPKALEAATAIATHHVRNGDRLYSAHPWTFTRCQEWILHQSNDYLATVGGFKSSGFVVGSYSHDSLSIIGVAGCRKLDRCVRRDVLNILLTMAGSEPTKAIQLLDVLLVAAQDNDCRQQALKALGQVAQASPNMFSACLPSLRAAARAGDKDVCLLALKTLGEAEWKHYFGEVEPAPDLPSDMGAILDSACPFWPGKKVRDTHLLVLVPAKINGQPFSLNLLRKLIRYPNNGGHKTQYRYYNSDVRQQIGTSSPAASYWLLMTRDVLPESLGKTYVNQKKLVTDHARRTSLPYELPKALEAVTAILTHHVRDGERLYSDSPRVYTRCQERILYESDEYPAVVGGFESSGLGVSHVLYDSSFHSGVAGCRKF
jgi:hypothetical protein